MVGYAVDAWRYMLLIRDWSDFISWYSWLNTPGKIVAGIIIFSVIYMCYIFLKGLLTDNEE